MKNTIRVRAAGILVKGDELLLVRHEKGDKTYWLLPGGGVDYGETVAQALVREFREECGIDIQVGPLVLVHDSIPPDQHRQVLNLYYTVSATDHAIHPGKDAVMKEVRFHPLASVPSLTVYPRITHHILDGIRIGWKDGCRYLGNVWDD